MSPSETARAAAGRGDAALRAAVRLQVDLENTTALRTLAGRRIEGGEEPFLPGGERVGVEVLHRLLASPTEAPRRLARAFAGTRLRPAFEAWTDPGDRWERGLLRGRLEEARQQGRLEPLGTAPILTFALALRVEETDLRNLAWGLALGRPQAWLVEGLVTP